jgi:senataxin
LLRRYFGDLLGNNYTKYVEVNTVDAFQGREAKIVIFSAVRASGSHGIGFLSDVRRMNVALTRAKHFLFVIINVATVAVNPYWGDLVQHARETMAVVKVPMLSHPERGNSTSKPQFGNLVDWKIESSGQKIPGQHRPSDPRKRKRSV